MMDRLIEKILFKRRAKTQPQRINEENQNRIIALLESIDFARSRLPAETLSYKSSPDLPCGDLEFTVKMSVKNIFGSYRLLNFDLTDFDTVLLEIIAMFKTAVEEGGAETSKDAKLAVWKCINEVRCRIPEKCPEPEETVKAAALYAAEWRDYLETENLIDRILNNTQCRDAAQKELLKKKAGKIKTGIKRGILLLNTMPVGFRQEEIADLKNKTGVIAVDRQKIGSEINAILSEIKTAEG